MAQLALGLATGASKGRAAFDAAWAALVPPLADPTHPLHAVATTADLSWAMFTLLAPLADDALDLARYLQRCGSYFAAWPLTAEG